MVDSKSPTSVACIPVNPSVPWRWNIEAFAVIEVQLLSLNVELTVVMFFIYATQVKYSTVVFTSKIIHKYKVTVKYSNCWYQFYLM